MVAYRIPHVTDKMDAVVVTTAAAAAAAVAGLRRPTARGTLMMKNTQRTQLQLDALHRGTTLLVYLLSGTSLADDRRRRTVSVCPE